MNLGALIAMLEQAQADYGPEVEIEIGFVVPHDQTGGFCSMPIESVEGPNDQDAVDGLVLYGSTAEQRAEREIWRAVRPL